MSEEEKKIFIDEGWKAQVQREKEEAARKAAAVEAPAQAQAPAEADEPALEDDPDAASFTALIGSLATQAMFALGLVAEPGTGQVMVNLDAARYTLDLMIMLQEKTAGNLTQDESQGLAQALGELEQAFAVRVQQFEQQAMRQSGVDPANLKGAPEA
ncbi:MAG: DUF1844 domain-containing protein [Candidatus Hydrogenedentes bacterium]|nr:DUF1844 domain-containing protein [Candidatus Hydrogenedentota bacterium]